MRELVILAALVSALYAASLPAQTDVEYKCQEDQDDNAKLAVEKFIHAHHRHGYKFRLVSLDSRSVKEEKSDSCEVVFAITLEETDCHIVNPKALDQCNVRIETETKVTAKCNVTISSAEGKAAVTRYICDTEPASHAVLVTKCPDCPSLLPLHDPKGLESVKSALQKFNKESNHKSYFKLMEVGRISTQWMFSGQSFFAQFAIMETNCSKAASENPEACKALCGEQARYGFCKSSKVGTEKPEVECEIYEAQNLTHPMQHPAQTRRDCGFRGPPGPHHPGHRPGHIHPLHPEGHGHGHKDRGHGHGGRPDHAGHDGKDKKPDHRGRPEHEGHEGKDKKPDHRGRPEHEGHGGKDKKPDQRGRPEHEGHEGKDKKHDHRGRPEHPHICAKPPSGVPELASEGRPEFPCHGFVKIPPSIYPICPFPPPRLCLPDHARPSLPPPSPLQ